MLQTRTSVRKPEQWNFFKTYIISKDTVYRLKHAGTFVCV